MEEAKEKRKEAKRNVTNCAKRLTSACQRDADETTADALMKNLDDAIDKYDVAALNYEEEAGAEDPEHAEAPNLSYKEAKAVYTTFKASKASAKAEPVKKDIEFGITRLEKILAETSDSDLDQMLALKESMDPLLHDLLDNCKSFCQLVSDNVAIQEKVDDIVIKIDKARAFVRAKQISQSISAISIRENQDSDFFDNKAVLFTGAFSLIISSSISSG